MDIVPCRDLDAVGESDRLLVFRFVMEFRFINGFMVDPILLVNDSAVTGRSDTDATDFEALAC